MSKVAVIATIDVAVGRMAEVLPRLIEHRERCLATEPGTLIFEIMKPNDTPDTLMLYEAYEDQAAFDAHWNGASIARLRQETDGIMSVASGIWGIPAT